MSILHSKKISMNMIRNYSPRSTRRSWDSPFCLRRLRVEQCGCPLMPKLLPIVLLCRALYILYINRHTACTQPRRCFVGPNLPKKTLSRSKENKTTTYRTRENIRGSRRSKSSETNEASRSFAANPRALVASYRTHNNGTV